MNALSRSAIHVWLTRRGHGAALWLNAWARVFSFAGVALIGALSPSTYNKATRQVVQKQIYFTAWQILPGFALFSAIFSVFIIELMGRNAGAYGLNAFALDLIVRVLVLEILPLMTALFVALRTGAAINTEVSLMQIQNELGALERTGIDPFRLELLPRVVGGTISVLALTAVNVVVALLLARLMIMYLSPWSLPPGEFARVMGSSMDLPAIGVLWAKTFAFGFAVTVIPISEGLNTPKKLYYAPISVSHGMVRLFFALMVIEFLALTALYL